MTSIPLYNPRFLSRGIVLKCVFGWAFRLFSLLPLVSVNKRGCFLSDLGVPFSSAVTITDFPPPLWLLLSSLPPSPLGREPESSGPHLPAGIDEAPASPQAAPSRDPAGVSPGGRRSESGACGPVRGAPARHRRWAAWPPSAPHPRPGWAKLGKVNMSNATGIMINRNKKGQNQKGFVKRKTAGNKAENSSAPRQFRLQNTNH